jgi:hypothetical protein
MAAGVGVAAAWVVLASLAIFYVGGAVVNGVARGLALAPRAIVRLVVAFQEGADWWSIAGRVGSAIAGTLGTSQVALSLIALELVGVAALYALLRLIGDEEVDK